MTIRKQQQSSPSYTLNDDGSGVAKFTLFIVSYGGTNAIHVDDVATPTGVNINMTNPVTLSGWRCGYSGGGEWNITGPYNSVSYSATPSTDGKGFSLDLPALGEMQAYYLNYEIPFTALDSSAVTDGKKRIENTVTVTTDNGPTRTSSAGVTMQSPAISKSVSKDANNVITWTIKVGRDGESLEGFVLDDSITMSPNNGGGYNNETITLTNGSYTFPSGKTGIVILTYVTPVTSISSDTTVTKGSNIILSCDNDNDKVWLEVKDDGEGISDKDKEHIFELFYTGDKKIVDSYRSMGIGLHYCYQTIKAHRQEIEILDNKPHGAIFRFSLEREVVGNE